MTTSAIFYVYAYFRPDGRPCYIGKGKGNRIAHRGKTGRNKHFLNILAQAKASGQEMQSIKIAEGLTDQEAIQLEKDMILLIGREANGGPLVNLTDGGDGAAGYRYTPEQREAHSARMRDRVMPPGWRENISIGLKKSEKVKLNAGKAGRATRGIKKSSGWWSTEEGRAKQRANNPGHTGYSHSEEAKNLIKAARAKQPKHISPSTQFTLGTIPWNKGMKGLQLSPATQFKEGYQPSEETREKLKVAVARSWARRKTIEALLAAT